MEPDAIAFIPKRRDMEVELAGRVYRLQMRLLDALKLQQDKVSFVHSIAWDERRLDTMVDGFRTRFSELEHERDRLKKEGRSADVQSVQSLIDRYLAALDPCAHRLRTSTCACGCC